MRRADASFHVTGRMELDGAGGLLGTRVLQRRVAIPHESIPLDFHGRWESVEQELSGTYVVEPDGRGRMSLTAAPSPTWIYPNRESGSSHESRFDFFGSELVRFTLADGGRSLLLTQELHAIRRFGGDPRVSDGDVLLVGRADRQDPLEIDIPEPEPDPRIDDLLEEVGDLRRSNALLAAQLCEILRLLNTPEGRRSADSDEVVEACGTAFEWNGEGTDAPGSRRGPRG